jgi:molecular chaperone GrpE
MPDEEINKKEEKKDEFKNQLDDLRAALSKCEQERAEYLAGWQRAKADFINYKKEEAQRIESMIRFGNESLMRELIGVLDSFDLSEAVLDAHDPGRKGIALIRSQLENLLKKYGLERIPSLVGQAFDASLAEAIEEVESELPAGRITEEIAAGYKLASRVIRPTRVKISKGKS